VKVIVSLLQRWRVVINSEVVVLLNPELFVVNYDHLMSKMLEYDLILSYHYVKWFLTKTQSYDRELQRHCYKIYNTTTGQVRLKKYSPFYQKTLSPTLTPAVIHFLHKQVVLLEKRQF
jgi:hypothetical protein